MVDKQREFGHLLEQGVSVSEACRRLGIDRKTGHWWKNGGVIQRNGATRLVAPVVGQMPAREASPRYLSLEERTVIADGVHAGKSARAIAAELGRAVSTVSKELQRNSTAADEYRPHAAHASMLARRPRAKQRILARDAELRRLVQGYLDEHWSPAQIANQLATVHGRRLAVETIYQALYCPEQVIQREASLVLRTKRPHRRPRRRGDQRRPRFIVPIQMIDQRPLEVRDRSVPGHWEGDLIVGSFNRSAIGTLVERTTRFTLLIHLAGPSRADCLREQLCAVFGALPAELRRSLTWDQGAEMCHHHTIAAATGTPIFFCHPGRPWQRPSNENTNGLLRDYFPKSTDLRIYSAADLRRVSDELNRRPRKTLGWHTPEALFARLLARSV